MYCSLGLKILSASALFSSSPKGILSLLLIIHLKKRKEFFLDLISLIMMLNWHQIQFANLSPIAPNTLKHFLHHCRKMLHIKYHKGSDTKMHRISSDIANLIITHFRLKLIEFTKQNLSLKYI